MKTGDWVMWNDCPATIMDVLDDGERLCLMVLRGYDRKGAPLVGVSPSSDCSPITKEVVDIMRSTL